MPITTEEASDEWEMYKRNASEDDMHFVLGIMKAVSSRNTKHSRISSGPSEITMPAVRRTFEVEDDSFEAHIMALQPLTEDQIHCCNYYEKPLTATTSKDFYPSIYKRKRSQVQRSPRKIIVESSLQIKASEAGSRDLENDLLYQPLSRGRQTPKTGQVGRNVGLGFGAVNKSEPRATRQGIKFYEHKSVPATIRGLVRSRLGDRVTASGQSATQSQIQPSLSSGTQIPETGQVGAYVGFGFGETMNDFNESAPKASPYKGINFYKRIGRWTAHLWDGKQHYMGSYPSASEAASAYDKASLKHFSENAQLNNEDDYSEDKAEMAKMTEGEYRLLLKKRAKVSKPNYVAEGITLCPKGWYEVKIRVKVPTEEETPPQKKVKKTQKVNAEGVPVKMIWLFLGRFRTLKEAKRCYENESKLKASKWSD